MQIALRDLEIRGAGNLLGSEQSGHMAAVGFDLYIRLLGEAVERLKALDRGETPPPPTSSRPAVTMDLPLTAYLPDGYVPDLNMRLALYQRIANLQDDTEAAVIEQELIDRFGKLPVAARNLLWLVRVRLMATVAGLGAVQTEGDDIVLRMLPGLSLDRDAVRRKLPPGANALTHQVRLNRDTIGENWREALVRAIDAVTPPDPVALRA
jgi:transcription-repair coupling factor (superfamily II helicase)